MIPIKLSLRGLYSYRETQVIDFTQLTEASIFGIFGKVGSGKSSILEAITFALYGDTERMNKSGDDRNYNMMNLRSDELLIDYVCQAGKENNTYRFTVKGRRNSKKFSDVKTFERKSYQWMSEINDWAPIEVEDSAEKIIGLSYENFKRTIIIPQGRFQEFIDLPLSKRAQMMNDIFQLGKYDLAPKVKVLKEQNEKQLENLAGKLTQLGLSTPEQLAQRENELQANLTLVKIKDSALAEKVADEKNLDILAKLFRSLEETTVRLSVLEQQAPHFQDKENRLKQYQACLLHFKPLFSQQQTRLAEKQRDEQVYAHKIQQQAEALTQIQAEESRLLALTPVFNHRENLKKEADELQWVLKWKEYKTQKIALEVRSEKGKKTEELQKQKIQALKNERIVLDESLAKIKKELIDVQRVSLVANWFSQKKQIQHQQTTIIESGKDSKLKIDQFEKQIQDLWLSDELQAVQEQLKTLLTNAEKVAFLHELKADYVSKAELQQQHIAHLETQKALQAYAQALIDNEPCPLCGAVHHPAKLTSEEDFTLKIAQEKNLQKQWQQQAEKIEAIKTKCLHWEENIASWVAERTKYLAQYKTVQAQLQEHEQGFVWSDFAKDDEESVQKAFDLAKNQAEQIKQIEESLVSKDQAINLAQVELEEKIIATLQKIALEIASKDTELKTAEQQIKQFALADFEYQTNDAIETQIKNVLLKYEQISKEFETLQVQIQQQRDQQHILQGEITALQKNIAQHQTSLDTLEQQIIEQLRASSFSDLAEVQAVLTLNLAVEQEQAAIDTFKLDLNTNRTRLQELKAETQGLRYDESIHTQLQQEIALLGEELNALRKEEGGLRNLVEKLKKDLADQAELLKQKEALELRKADIDTLAKLFKSSGFVSFVSAMYLQNLCNQANVRFSKMTRQQLQLEIYEVRPAEYDFQVRDLLNEGRTRAVKTLSGGQKFQVALSLALALADNIHAQTQSQHNFFFLDEGFGSLDKDALVEVFDTLKSLRKENRIVGVISHVEDLQQEIDRYINVYNDPEQGSVIQVY